MSNTMIFFSFNAFPHIGSSAAEGVVSLLESSFAASAVLLPLAFFFLLLLATL